MGKPNTEKQENQPDSTGASACVQTLNEQHNLCPIHAPTPWQPANCLQAPGYSTYKPTSLARAPGVLPATERATLQHMWPCTGYSAYQASAVLKAALCSQHRQSVNLEPGSLIRRKTCFLSITVSLCSSGGWYCKSYTKHNTFSLVFLICLKTCSEIGSKYWLSNVSYSVALASFHVFLFAHDHTERMGTYIFIPCQSIIITK